MAIKTIRLVTFLSIAFFCVSILISCNNNSKTDTAKEGISCCQSSATPVELLLLHSKKRCITCKAIEDETKNVLNGELADLAKEGKVSLKVIDLSSDQGKELAKKFKVSWTSLFLIDNTGNEEIALDITKFAFANARNNPDAFKKEIQDKVRNIFEQ